MNILILSTSIPYPPTSGGAIRVHGILEGLIAAGHRVTLLAFHDGALPGGINPQIDVIHVPSPQRALTDRLRALLLTRQPDLAGRFYSDALRERLRDLLHEQTFDLIQFEGIEMSCYLPLAKLWQPSARLCFDTFNAEYALQHTMYQIDRANPRRWHAAAYSWIQVGRLRRYEGDICRMADLVIAVSPEDAALLRQFRADQTVYVVPNGIHTERFSAPVDLGEYHFPPDMLVFTGKMDYRPNVDAVLWFAESILPRIQAVVPAAQLYVVGQQPHPRLDALRQHPQITLTGRVEAVQPYLQAAAVYIAPLRMGSGTRLKLLEALAAGCAIVATPLAASGLTDEIRQSMRVEADAVGFADAVIDLLQSSERRHALQAAGQAQIRAHYDWSVLIPRLLTAYQEIGLG